MKAPSRPPSASPATGTVDETIDQASMDSFPASDPPPFWASGPPLKREPAAEMTTSKMDICGDI